MPPMNSDGIAVHEVPDLGSVRKHLAAAHVHLEVCAYRGQDMSKRHKGHVDMALRWIKKLEAELKVE